MKLEGASYDLTLKNEAGQSKEYADDSQEYAIVHGACVYKTGFLRALMQIMILTLRTGHLMAFLHRFVSTPGIGISIPRTEARPSNVAVFVS